MKAVLFAGAVWHDLCCRFWSKRYLRRLEWVTEILWRNGVPVTGKSFSAAGKICEVTVPYRLHPHQIVVCEAVKKYMRERFPRMKFEIIRDEKTK